jgi:glyoxylate reductase
MKPILYVVRALPGGIPPGLQALLEIRGGATHPVPREALLRQAAGASILAPSYLDPVDDALLAGLPGLRRVCSYGVGVNHIDLEACRRRGVVVTNTPGVVTNATADLAFGLLLAAARRVCELDRAIRAGRWTEVDPSAWLGTEVTGKTLGIVGFGRIGQAVARRARGFEMRLLYAGRAEVPFEGARRVALEELLGESDFVSLHVPLTPATENLLSRERIRAMKRGAILVNTARGPVVDDSALAEALADGHLAAAGLDVFRDEPRVPEALRRLENVVLTPHVGSGSRETREAMSRMVWDEVERAATGREPRNRVA